MESGDALERLTHLLQGYRATCLLIAGVQLGLIEQLSAGPLSEAELARRMNSHSPSLTRFLRGLEAIGIIERDPTGIRLSAMGKLLLKDESVMADIALLTGEEYLPAWANLRHTVQTGGTAFDASFGMSAWEHRKQRPELNEAFTRLMRNAQDRTQRAVLSAYDFSPCHLVVDVGGGSGTLMAEILGANPSCTGVVFDQPHVVAHVQNGMPHPPALRNRCQFVAGSFFESIPTGGDIYLLQHILHDWDDPQCLEILRNCHAAMQPASKLLIIENLLPDTPPPAHDLVMLDLHMMAVLGGRERTRPEFEQLLASAGFSVTLSLPTQAQTTIIEAARSS